MENSKIRDVLNNIVVWIQSNKVLSAVSSGMAGAVGLLLVGSIFSILRQLPFDAYQTYITTSGLKDIFNIPVQFTTNLFAVYAAFSIAYNYTTKSGKDGLMPGLLSLFTFLSFIPITKSEAGIDSLEMTYLGSQGLFVAIIVGVLVAILYQTIIEKKLYIRMPESVPVFVQRGFASMTPCLVLGVIVVIINFLVRSAGLASVNSLIYTLIQMPLQNVVASPWAIVLAVFLTQIMWWFGIHGVSAVMSAVFMPILHPLTIENLTAYNAGLPLPHLFHYDTLLLSFAGGCGATLGLCIAMTFLAKSKQYKTIGRLCLVPGIFGVNEPVIFGVPIVLNPRMFLPWVLYPTIVTIIGCICITYGIIEPYNGLHVSNVPSFITSFLYMGIRGGIFNILVIIGSFFVYWFFGVKKLDQEAYEQEQEAFTHASEEVL